MWVLPSSVRGLVTLAEPGERGVVAGGGLAPGLVPGRQAAQLGGQDDGLQGVHPAVHADDLVHVLARRAVLADQPDQARPARANW